MKIDLDTPSFGPTIDVIRAELPLYLQSPRVGIICGSGLSTIATTFHKVVKIPYAKIPGFSKSTGKFHMVLFLILGVELLMKIILLEWIVPGHDSTLAFGLLGGEDGVPVVAMLGRVNN